VIPVRAFLGVLKFHRRQHERGSRPINSMPPRIPSVRQTSRATRNRPTDIFFCPSCSIWRLNQPRVATLRIPPQARALSRFRNASTLVSTTAINPPLEVAAHNQELYRTLDGLKQNAANYVNLSRLQLALRGLETKEAVVRVAGRHNTSRQTLWITES